MAKKLKAEAEAPDAGSAPQIPNRDEQDVFVHHLNRIRTQQNKTAIAKAAYDAEKSTETDLFREAKADGFTRKELQAILDDGKASRRDLVAEEERRAMLRTWAGLPAGSQPDLFDLPSPARDEIDAEAEGYQRGLRGEDPVVPDHISPNYTDAFMKGWHAAQRRRAEAFGQAPANDDAGATDEQAAA